MFKIKCLCLLSFLFLIFCISATGQEPLTQGQIHHVSKVKKNLAQYDTGTKLDVQLSDGSHHIGTLTETGPTGFVLIDSASSRSQSIDYLDVKRVKASGNRCSGTCCSRSD